MEGRSARYFTVKGYYRPRDVPCWGSLWRDHTAFLLAGKQKCGVITLAGAGTITGARRLAMVVPVRRVVDRSMWTVSRMVGAIRPIWSAMFPAVQHAQPTMSPNTGIKRYNIGCCLDSESHVRVVRDIPMG